jgi:hypothetical protein
MRNCLQSYVENCACGNFEVYSVRFAASGKRKGCVGIRFDSDGMPTVADVKGFANMPPTGELLQVADDLICKLQRYDIE